MTDGSPGQARHVLFAALPFYGHLIPLIRQGEELARRGWRVSIASGEDARRHLEGRPGLTFVSLGELELNADEIEALFAGLTTEPSFVKNYTTIAAVLSAVWPSIYDRALDVLRHDRPDVAVVDLSTWGAQDAVISAGVRLVVNHPGLLSYLPIGVLPPAPALPLPLSGRSVHEIDRRYRLLQPLRHWARARMTSLAWRRILEPRRRSRGLAPIDVRRRLAEVLILVNTAFGLEYGRPLPPLVQMVGPMLPADDAPLAPEDAAWLANGPPVAYVNLGTLAAPSPALCYRLAEGLRSDTFRALWVVRPGLQPTLPPDLPATVRVESWLPSPYAVLGHQNVRAFVSHCGINSAYESLAAGTPIVGIPLFADQQDMALQVHDAGVGLILRKDRCTPTELRESVTRVILDEAFHVPIPALRSSFALAGGACRAADLIEHVAQVGTDHYRTVRSPRQSRAAAPTRPSSRAVD